MVNTASTENVNNVQSDIELEAHPPPNIANEEVFYLWWCSKFGREDGWNWETFGIFTGIQTYWVGLDIAGVNGICWKSFFMNEDYQD